MCSPFLAFALRKMQKYYLDTISESSRLLGIGGCGRSESFFWKLFSRRTVTKLYTIIYGIVDSNEIPPLTIVIVGSVCILILYIFLTVLGGTSRTKSQAQCDEKSLILCLVYVYTVP